MKDLKPIVSARDKPSLLADARASRGVNRRVAEMVAGLMK